MTIEDLYMQIGGNYANAQQLLSSDRLIERFVLRFLDDPTYASLTAAMEVHDLHAAYAAAHTMKGLTLNLAFAQLADAAAQLTNALRTPACHTITEAQLESLYQRVVACYTQVASAIQAYEAERKG